MIAPILLVVIAIVYRIVIGVAGMTHMEWLHNFSPMAAIALCGAIFFPRRIAILAPLAAFLVSDLVLNAFYMASTPHVTSLLSARMIPEYLALGLSAFLGWKLRANPKASLILGASIIGSIAFYVITNTGDWLTEPLYAKTLAGWVQALTTGLPGYPPTFTFFRNTLASDLLFTAIFVACMAWQPRASAPEQVALAAR